ncbi:GEVED domain-containing protein [Puniceibacterium sp. IMCC21224]|uniref:GEVED domain-containing protein n=1 Tax=Puniceibacterium sp. IMCC21224 TaxID=1618204 RepID=UPI00065D8E2F|nr:GEVED domain-containing protein [Puniceibacterium sp. IMCC21224]KMK67834.1 protein of unknown function DUF11 [Puniceibacterium sp. IMCC21224]
MSQSVVVGGFRRFVYGLMACTTFGATQAQAGDFQIDWSTFDWPAGVTGPLVRTLRDQYGFEVDATVEHTGIFSNYSGSTPSPDDVAIFGGNVESLIIVSDAPQNLGAIGDSRTISTVSASSGGIAFPVDSLTIDVLDIDANDNNSTTDRCDFITAFGNNGNPTMAALSATPSVIAGPGPGSGLTGALGANQAQCIYVEGFAGSPTSPNDDSGTIRATFPDATSSVTFWYDESIQNVRNYASFINYDPGARGIGMFGNANFSVDQSISLSRSATPSTGTQGETVTYTYTVTNTGSLPFNPGQDVLIEDDLLGTVTCNTISTLIAPGGTVTCEAPYTITAADVLTGSVDSNAVAGIGAIGQPFVARLQSDTQPLSVVSSVILGGGGGAQNCTPQSVFAQPRTQLAGPGTNTNMTTSDIFLFDDVTVDNNGNPIDVVFQLDQISNAINLELTSGLQARMTPVDNGYVVYRLRLVQDGTATAANPLGTAIEQSRFNGIIVQQTDIDSRGPGDDSTDVGGPIETPTTISHFNTAPIASFPAGGNAIGQDPAKAGNPLDWFDEPNETDFDNYATYEYDTFVEARFIHGYTGTSTVPATRGSGILLCAIANTSADVIAEDDDYTASPVNTLLGGTAGEVMANDTILGLPATPLNATLEVLTEAVPQNLGDPVPLLETAGLDAGRVTVPAGVPAGVYTIEYRLCSAVDPTDCDRARVTIAVFEGLGLDFGDAPLSYLTASHTVGVVASVYLGATPPDIELVAQTDATATADDLLGTDDEDGLIFPVLTQGAVSTLEVTVNGAGYLQAWLDFNGDGLFEDALGERIGTDLRDDGTQFDNIAGDGVIQIDVTVPANATTSLTFSRFRYATDTGVVVAGLALDGEVEDHSLIIAAADLVDRGDAPASYGDPRHVVVPDIYLGAAEPDTETSPQNSVNADGDDLADLDDEDSVATFPVLEAGTTVSLTVQTHETLSAQLDLPIPTLLPGITNLQLWIDYNQNGVFDTSEHIAVDYRDGDTGDTDGVFNNQISFDISVPADIGNGQSYARLRWSTTSAVAADPFDGLNFDGEVEDYLVTLSNPNGPLSCTANIYMVATETAQNLPALSELAFTESGGNYTLNQTLFPPDYTGNYLVTGWGYNELDDYIYGVRQSPRTLMRINAAGAVQEVADLSGLGIESPDSTADILPNGIMVYMSGTSNNIYQLLDISDPANPVNLGVLTAGAGSPYGRDIAYNPRDGMMYFIDPNRDVYILDPRDGVPGATTVTLVGNVPLPAGYGAIDIDSVWFDGSGFFYGFDNQSRQVFVVELGGDGDRPGSFQFIEVLGTVQDLTYQGNDGASCRAFPGPFVSTVFLDGTISGTLYEDANNSGVFDAGETGLPVGITVELYDENGTPANFADDTLVTSTETAADGTYSFISVDSSLTYRIQVDEADPEIPASLVMSTANPITGVTVATGTETPDQNFGFVTAAASADLSLTKVAIDVASGQPTTEATAGTEIDFVLSVTNDGPGSVTGVRVRDQIPNGYTYVSDDAAAAGDTYASSTGVWTVGDVANGATEVLTIRVTMNPTGEHTNRAEIVASSLPDPDSDPAVGALTDDLSDGVADDDEASAAISFVGTGAILSGNVFEDNGAGGATAYDGLKGGTEPATNKAVVSVLNASSVLIGTPDVAADGSWSLTLPEGYSDAVTVSIAPAVGLRTVSEAPGALPGLVNAAPRDGSFTFTPVPGVAYSDLNFGLIEVARLSQSQQSAIRAGQVVTLRHEYLADSDGTVIFDVDIQQASAPGLFSVGLFLDAACDGSVGAAVDGALPISANTRICLVARVSVSSAASAGSTIGFDLVADTTYGASGLTEQDRNTDLVRVESPNGALKLSKTVRNVTQGTPEGVSNGAAAGDVLEYRVYLENPGVLPATDIVIHDRTPPYTVLATAIPSPVNVGGDVVCSVAAPGVNAGGYSGALRWECTGTHRPGAIGAVSFQVQIAP